MSSLSALFGAAVPSALRSLATPPARSGSPSASSTQRKDDSPSTVLNRSDASTLGEFISRRFEINVQVESAAFRSLQQSNRPRFAAVAPAPTKPQSREELLEQIGGIDPKLAQGMRSLLELVEQNNPEAARAIEKSLGLVFGYLNQSQGNGIASPSQAPTSGAAPAPTTSNSGEINVEIQVQRVQVAISATLEDLQSQISSGVEITAQSIQISFSANFGQQLGQADPLVLDLNDNGFETTTAADGHSFDITGTGRRFQSATVAGGDALLVYDRNKNGSIDDGRELFGDQNGAADGFAELAKYDSNVDGRIDEGDDVFGQLALFRDSNRNGRTDDGELTSLSSQRIAAIQLQSRDASGDSNGNAISRVGQFLRDDGTQGSVGDLLLNYIA